MALIQNRIQPGGRFQVMAEMIFVLNELGIVPDVLTFRSRLTSENIQNFYSRNLDFQLKLIKPNLKIPFEWNIWWFNKVVSPKLGSYDLVINHNNSSYGLSTRTKVLSYVHFPRKARLMSGLKDFHFPEKGKVSRINAGKDLFNIMAKLYQRHQEHSPADVLVANSDFTRQNLLKAYPGLKGEAIEILYPPVDIDHKEKGRIKVRRVVSLGRFSPPKRQLEQIEIAASLPHLNFIFVGFAGDSGYFENCKAMIHEKKLSNVKIVSNAGREEVNEILESSWFFIHSMRYEPFGITPVQAIAAGCIPVVHDSGGQKEIVALDELRYSDTNGAVEVLGKLCAEGEEMLQAKSKNLLENIQKFGRNEFREKFKTLLNNLL